MSTIGVVKNPSPPGDDKLGLIFISHDYSYGLHPVENDFVTQTNYNVGDVLEIDYGRDRFITKVNRYLGNAIDNVIVDSREPTTVKEAFAMEVPLYGGDFFWISSITGKPVIVERKQLGNGELLRCLFMNQTAGVYETKLTTQARKMSHLQDAERFLLIELGEYEVDGFTGKIILPNAPVNGNSIWPFKWTAMQKAVRSLCETWYMYPWYSEGSRSTLANIKAIKEHTNKSYSQTQKYIDFDPKDAPKYGENISNPLQAICCTDGIGLESAKIALNEFGSIALLSTANLEEMMELPGFGRKKAEALYDLLHEVYNADSE